MQKIGKLTFSFQGRKSKVSLQIRAFGKNVGLLISRKNDLPPFPTELKRAYCFLSSVLLQHGFLGLSDQMLFSGNS